MHECVCAKPVCFLLFKNKRDKILSKKMILKNVETKALRIVSRFYFGPSHTNSDCLRIDRCPKAHLTCFGLTPQNGWPNMSSKRLSRL